MRKLEIRGKKEGMREGRKEVSEQGKVRKEGKRKGEDKRRRINETNN